MKSGLALNLLGSQGWLLASPSQGLGSQAEATIPSSFSPLFFTSLEGRGVGVGVSEGGPFEESGSNSISCQGAKQLFHSIMRSFTLATVASDTILSYTEV